MALQRVAKGLYESYHFRMYDPKHANKTMFYKVEARTDIGLTHLPAPTAHLPNVQARTLIESLEHAIAYGTPRPPQVAKMPLKTSTDLAAFREACFPGLSIMGGRRRLAGVLGMSIGHMKHLESGKRLLHPRTAQLLRAYARVLVAKSRYSLKADAKALEPFADLYEALALDEATEQ